MREKIKKRPQPTHGQTGRAVYVLNIYALFLWRNHTNKNNPFRLVCPIYDMDTYIFKVGVFTQQAKYE